MIQLDIYGLSYGPFHLMRIFENSRHSWETSRRALERNSLPRQECIGTELLSDQPLRQIPASPLQPGIIRLTGLLARLALYSRRGMSALNGNRLFGMLTGSVK